MRQLRQLPDRPDLDQLRHQARDLQRAAARGDVDASRRRRANSPRATLSSAQLALAREYGFPSWARLRAEVARRRIRGPEHPPARYVIRPVASQQELAEAFDVIGAQMTPGMTHEDRRFQDLVRRFAEDRPLMVLVEELENLGDQGRIVGGALAFRTGPRGVTLRVLGLDPRARGRGLGRRLMEKIELEAMRLGVAGISRGAAGDVTGFYARMGYAGRGSMMHKELPLPGRFLEARLRKLEGATDDLVVSAR